MTESEEKEHHTFIFKIIITSDKNLAKKWAYFLFVRKETPMRKIQLEDYAHNGYNPAQFRELLQLCLKGVANSQIKSHY